MTDQLTRSLPVLFIGGLGRSGSTVFELSLGTDDRVVALGEVLHLWQRSLIDGEPCGCGQIFSDCDFWKDVGKIAFGGWEHVVARDVLSLRNRIDRTVRVPQLWMKTGSRTWRRAVEEYASYYSRIYRAAAIVAGGTIVIDSSKQASLPYVLRYAQGIDLRVLHCVRDSRAVAYSWSKNVFRPESQTGGATYMTRYPPALSALKWLQHNSVVDGLNLRGVPTRRVRYEDWVSAPVETVQSALEFGQLSRRDNPSLSDEWVDLPMAHTCSGNPMRFTRGRVEIRRDEKWREDLPARSRRLVTALTSPGLAAYGYLKKGN